jgi:hypothetical protein
VSQLLSCGSKKDLVDREVIATRRVTGPRREEVATRTGVSTDLPREDGARHGNELGFVHP